MRIKIINENQYETNTYVLFCEKTGLGAIVDPVGSYDFIKGYLEENQINIKYILLTHGHFDHIQLVSEIKELTKASVCIHEKDAEMINDEQLNLSRMFGQPLTLDFDKQLQDGQILELGKYEIQVIHTPGHTMGSCCFIVEDYLFSGDTLFKNTIGRTDLLNGSYKDILLSLKKISKLDPQLKVFPGHGEETVLEEEFKHNPYFSKID